MTFYLQSLLAQVEAAGRSPLCSTNALCPMPEHFGVGSGKDPAVSLSGCGLLELLRDQQC